MKKLFAILMVLTLVAGASFAQVSVFGGAHAKVHLVEGNGDGNIYGSGSVGQARIGLRGENEAGTFGAMVRASFNGNFPGGALGSNPTVFQDNNLRAGDIRANVWWKPIEQFTLLLGQPGDGWWGKRNVSGWGFNASANDTVAVEHWNYNAFYDGTGGGNNALLIAIAPVDFIGVNFMLPFMAGQAELGDIFKSMHAQVDLNLAFGNIAISYVGGGDFDYSAGTMYVSAGLGMIPNVDLHIGVAMALPGTYTLFSDSPILIGIGAEIAIGDRFGIKARVETEFGGYSYVTIGGVRYAYQGNFGIKFGVLPSFAINDTFKVFFNLGLGMSTNDYYDKANVNFIVNPYIRIDGGPGAFWAGFKLEADNGATSKPQWSIPIGITFGF